MTVHSLNWKIIHRVRIVESCISFRLITPALSGFDIILNDSSLMILNWLFSRLFAHIFLHLNFPQKHKWLFWYLLMKICKKRQSALKIMTFELIKKMKFLKLGRFDYGLKRRMYAYQFNWNRDYRKLTGTFDQIKNFPCVQIFRLCHRGAIKAKKFFLQTEN